MSSFDFIDKVLKAKAEIGVWFVILSFILFIGSLIPDASNPWDDTVFPFWILGGFFLVAGAILMSTHKSE